MVSKLRAKRIADRINEILSEMLIYDVSDPRLVGVSVTDVKVDREMALANIFVSALEGALILNLQDIIKFVDGLF